MESIKRCFRPKNKCYALVALRVKSTTVMGTKVVVINTGYNCAVSMCSVSTERTTLKVWLCMYSKTPIYRASIYRVPRYLQF